MVKRYNSETVDLIEVFILKAEEAYDKVPAIYYDIVLHDTNTLVGRIDLRLTMNKRMYYYGNIGYFILEKYRGHHYALDACKILKDVARDDYHMDKLIITCNPDNKASYTTLEQLGCTYKGIEKVPISHELYWRNEKYKAIFELELKDGKN